MLGLGLSIPQVATRTTGVPYRITIGGIVYERVLLDGTFVEIDGLPLYMEIVVYERVLIDGTFVEIDGLPLYMEI